MTMQITIDAKSVFGNMREMPNAKIKEHISAMMKKCNVSELGMFFRT